MGRAVLNGLMCAAVAAAAVVVSALAVPTVAEARDGCGRGYFFDGYGCRPERRYGPPPGYYGPPPGYYGPPRPRYYEEPGTVLQFNFGGGGGRDERRYAPPVRGQGGRLVCAQRGYTIQDGLCKPYTGR